MAANKNVVATPVLAIHERCECHVIPEIASGVSSLKASGIRTLRNRKRRSLLLIVVAENLATAILIVQSVVVARTLGPAGTGIYSLALAHITLFGQAVCLGIPQAYTFSARQRPQKEVAYFRAAVTILLITSCVGCTLLPAAIWRLSEDFRYAGWLFWLSVFIYVPVIALRPLFRNALNLRGYFGRLATVPILAASIQTGLVVWLAFSGQLTATWAIVAFVAAAFARTTLSLCWPLIRQAKKVRPAQPIYRLLVQRNWSYFGVFMAISLNTQLPVILMDILGSENRQLGYFSRALQVAALVPLAVQGLMPLLFNQWAGRPFHMIRATLRECIIVACVLLVPLTICIFLFGDELLVLLFGEAFRPAYPALVVLQLASLPLVVIRIITQALGSQGHQRWNIVAYIAASVSVALFSGGQAWVMGKADSMGMAVAVLGGCVVASLVLTTVFKSKHRDSLSVETKSKGVSS